jgi:alkanesulfonate monooxygenase SsuD/methylene tetrahydromethanopterin reductase-like flavin-dependent oxidoreductase (luciferase family)
MAANSSRRRDRQETNPAFNGRRLKLGTFQTNLDSGCVMSDLDGRIDITWPNTIALARLAEEMEFEALVPVARWQGFGGATNPQGPGFEAYTWAAGIAASTKKPGVFATSHITLNHPIIAAKQSTVIDHISDGRYALNIVTGWNQPEIDMFGNTMLSHADRYACAEEWLTIVRRLWTEDDPVDFEGKFYKISQGYLEQVVVADDGDIPSTPAVDVFGFAARHRAAWMAQVNSEPGFGHRLGHHRIHLPVRCLQVVTWPLSGADIGTKMNPSFGARYESRSAFDEGRKAQVTELIAAGSNK